MLVKVAAVQTRLGQHLSLAERLIIYKQKAEFVCFPEYFLIDAGIMDYNRAALMIRDNLKYLTELSQMLGTCVIGGTVVEAEGDFLHNSSYLINRGEIIGRYRKLNPTSNEIRKGILPGDKIFTAVVDDVRIALMICADALNTALFDSMFDLGVDIIFVPTVSPYRPNETKLEKFHRDEEIFVRGARAASSYIVKTCGVGTIFGKPLQGRSLIASPWGILKRIEPHVEDSPGLLSEWLDIDEIRDFAKKKRLVSETLKEI